MKTLTCLLLFAVPALAQDASELVRQGESLLERGSFEQAHGLFLRADALELEGALATWIDFRVADSSWRSAAQSDNPDSSRLETARAGLEKLLAGYKEVADRDDLWAELQESLGDYHWDRRQSMNWSQGWVHYSQALDWWAGSREIERARGRYLQLVHRMVLPAWWGGSNYHYSSYGNRLRIDVLERAARIAVDPADKGWTSFFLGFARYQNGGQPERQALAREAYQEVVALGKSNPWHDDALYHLGIFLEERGEVRFREDGGQYWEQDYVGAVARYRALIEAYHKGETRYYDEARHRIAKITGAELSLSVDRFFVPDSEVQFRLRWRNVQHVSLALHPVDLTRDVDPNADNPGGYLQRLQLDRAAPTAVWTHATGDEGQHRPGNDELVLETKPKTGAYVLVASSGGLTTRALVLVSDAMLVTKDAGERLLVWFTDLNSGQPIPEARVFLWERYYDNGNRLRHVEGTTGADGTLVFDLKRPHRHSNFFVSAASGPRQAFTLGSGYRVDPTDGAWKVYAFSDRPAYRPGDQVQWKAIARILRPDGYETPIEDEFTVKVLDAREQVVVEETATSNAFGALWGALTLEAEQPLGSYHFELWQGNNRRSRTELFRFEEYKLPEYEVSVQLPDDPARPGGKVLHRLGDRVEAEVQASYYFGGPVAEADVEVLVYQRPYYHAWQPRREYPWFYAGSDVYHGWWGGPGQLVTRENLKTDARGKLMVTIDTPAGSGHDLEYTIEARVVDASRREVVSTDTLRVTRQAYYVQLEPTHQLHRPGDRVEIELQAEDANQNPMGAAGEVVVTRDTWAEIWTMPGGEELRGAALERLRRKHPVFPPPGESGWVLKYNGYEHEEVARSPVRIGDDGRGEFAFHAAREGYYTVVWTSEDDRKQRIRSQAAFFVADENSSELGYRHGGVDIIVDKETFRAGDEAAVMLATPANDRYVLFTVEGESLHHHQVVHLTGRVKLLRLPIGKAHIPNAYLAAAMVDGRQVWWDQEEVVVPPVEQFLDVELALDQEAYEPGQGGTATLTVRDHAGEPVRGDLSLSIYDASLGYIQQDLAGDPREFFYGERRQQLVRTNTTLNQGGFQRLVKDKEGLIVDERYAWREERDRSDGPSAPAGSKRQAGKMAGFGGGGPTPGDFYADSADSFFLGSVAEPAAEMSFNSNIGIGGGGGGRLQALAQPGLEGQEQAARPDLSSVQVRSDFRDTAVWRASVVLDDRGRATVEVPFPQSTTRWRAVARVADAEARFGIGEGTALTRQPLIARLQGPRFLQVGDEVTISANLNNNTEAALVVHALLEAEGVELVGRLLDGELLAPETGPLEIPASAQQRVDWLVRVVAPGEAKLNLKAASPEHSDGMVLDLPVYEHGIDVLAARAGKLTGRELALALDLPAERRAGSSSLSVQLTPSLAVTMLDALPYLVDYPYGCTEQTLSRFVPAVVVAKTLGDLGLGVEEAMTRVFGGIEREHVDRTHPKGHGPLARLDDVVAQGLARLYDFQHADGGWAWWKRGDSDHWMSAYVVWGLTLAQEAGVKVRADVLERGRRFLELEIVERELDLDVQAWMLFALAKRLNRDEAESPEAERAFNNLWAKRRGLNAYSRALFASAAHELGHAERARTLAENLANGVIRDDSPDTSVVQVGEQTARDDALKTAHWGEDGIYSRWSQGGVEATAFALKALLEVDPDHELVAPALNWLVQNRRGSQWSNTRDTAMVVLALNDYLQVSGELASDVEYELVVNGTSIARTLLARDELLAAPSVFEVDPDLLRGGSNDIRVVRHQGGPLYFAAYAEFFSHEEPIAARGNQLFVRREYYRLKPVPTLLKGVVYEKEKLEDGATVNSGDRIEVVLTAEAKNHLEYLAFEDLKPAGFEAVQVQSGQWMVARELKSNEVQRRFVEGGPRESVRVPGGGPAAYAWRQEEGYTGRTRGLHQELRDRKVALFADRLPQGVWEMRYELRAETPGKFHALPVLGHAMYVPEIRCNSTELRVDVVDRGVL